MGDEYYRTYSQNTKNEEDKRGCSQNFNDYAKNYRTTDNHHNPAGFNSVHVGSGNDPPPLLQHHSFYNSSSQKGEIKNDDKNSFNQKPPPLNVTYQINDGNKGYNPIPPPLNANYQINDGNKGFDPIPPPLNINPQISHPSYSQTNNEYQASNFAHQSTNVIANQNISVYGAIPNIADQGSLANPYESSQSLQRNITLTSNLSNPGYFKTDTQLTESSSLTNLSSNYTNTSDNKMNIYQNPPPLLYHNHPSNPIDSTYNHGHPTNNFSLQKTNISLPNYDPNPTSINPDFAYNPDLSLNSNLSNPKINSQLRESYFSTSLKGSFLISNQQLSKENTLTYIKPKLPDSQYHTNIQKIQPSTSLKITDCDIPPSTISASWIKIDYMKSFAKFNKQFLDLIDKLKLEHNIIAWKQSRGDGNCYYRAVITRYMEKIFGFYSDSQNPKLFLSILEDLENKIMSNGQHLDSSGEVGKCKEWVKYLIAEQEKDPATGFKTLCEWLQSADFDQCLVKVSRFLTYFTLINIDKQTLADFSLEIESSLYKILSMGTEAEDVMLWLLPMALKIQVVQYNMFDRWINIEKYPDINKYEIVVNIVRRPGHYDILYSREECELDLYNLDSRVYHYISFHKY